MPAAGACCVGGIEDSMVENIKDCERIHLFRDISREEIEKMFRCSRTAERSARERRRRICF